MFNLSSVIVTHNPSSDRLINNINVLKKFSKTIYIFDNLSTNPDALIYLSSLNKISNVHIIYNDKNIGTVGALNYVLKLCVKYDTEFLITFDQDSLINETSLLNLYNFIINEPKVALIGPNIVDTGDDNNKSQGVQYFTESKHVITSGSIVRVQYVNNVGGWDNDFFLDGGDIDLNCRLIESGYNVGKLSTAFLTHSVGSRSTLDLYVMKISLLNHSSFRYFLMNRNRLIIIFRYKSLGFPFIVNEVNSYLKRNLSILFFEKNKFDNLMMLFKGFFSGLIYVFKR